MSYFFESKEKIKNNHVEIKNNTNHINQNLTKKKLIFVKNFQSFTLKYYFRFRIKKLFEKNIFLAKRRRKRKLKPYFNYPDSKFRFKRAKIKFLIAGVPHYLNFDYKLFICYLIKQKNKPIRFPFILSISSPVYFKKIFNLT